MEHGKYVIISQIFINETNFGINNPWEVDILIKNLN